MVRRFKDVSSPGVDPLRCLSPYHSMAAAVVHSTAQKPCLRSLLLRVEKIKSLNRRTLVLQCRVDRNNDNSQQAQAQQLLLRPGTRCLLHVVVAQGDDDDKSIMSSTVRSRLLLLLGSQAITSRWVVPARTTGEPLVALIDASGVHTRNRRGDVVIAASSIRSLAAATSDDMKESSSTNAAGSDDTITPPSNTTTDVPGMTMIHPKEERHTLFAHWLVQHYGHPFLSSGSGVLDVAGGNGRLSRSLVDHYGIPCHILDPHPRLADMDDTTTTTTSQEQQQQMMMIHIVPFALHADGSDLTEDVDDDDDIIATSIRSCSIVVGMHPDQATEPIVDLALRLGKPFAIVPCCVMPKLFPHRRRQQQQGSAGDPVRSYSAFCDYLIDKVAAYHDDDDDDDTYRYRAEQDVLPFWGRNKVLFMKAPPDKDSTR